MKKTEKLAVKKTEKKVSKTKKISSYEKRYDFIRDELYSLLPNEKSDICPQEAAIQIMLDCAIFGGNGYYEGLGMIEEAAIRLREWDKEYQSMMMEGK